MAVSVLFVDDSAVARARATRLLKDQGLEVTAFASRLEAAGVDPAGFAAALLDLELGDGLGTDIARELRGRSPALPIAFLTSSLETAALDEARALGPVFAKEDVEAAVAWIAARADLPA